MASTTLRQNGVVSAATAPGTDDQGRSRAAGLNALRWMGLLCGDRPTAFDELACQSLTGDPCGDDPSTWIA